MSELVRVKLQDGAEVTVAASFAKRHSLEPVSDEDAAATDRRGRPLAPQPAAASVVATEHGSSYDDLDYNDLRREIRVRNTGRADDDHIPASGNKADLVAALEADDNKSKEDQ